MKQAEGLVPIPPDEEFTHIFVDDAEQLKPTRERMGSLCCYGAVLVSGRELRPLEQAINSLRCEFGFPAKEIFKWSPRRGSWLHGQLIGDRREEFWRRLFTTATAHGVLARVVISDRTYAPARSGTTHEQATLQLLLERLNISLASARAPGLLHLDRPGGGAAQRSGLVKSCEYVREVGTEYGPASRLAPRAYVVDMRHSPLMQLADVVSSCALGLVGGNQYAEALASDLLPLLEDRCGRRGGIGLKIHPDFVYRNLYRWLLGDVVHMNHRQATALPDRSRPYASDANSYSLAPLAPW